MWKGLINIKTKSIWGNPPTRIYKLIKIAKKEWGNNFSACIVGCSDGKFLMPFARRHIHVKGYDIDDIALYGGTKYFPVIKKKMKYPYSPNFKSQNYKLEKKRVLGIIKRLEIEKVSGYANIEKRDFYRSLPKEKFNVVFTSCSLHYSINQDFTLEDKTKKLQSIVLPGGYLYIDYMMAIDEDDYKTYPEFKFYRKKEILKYFNEDWEILFIRENDNPSFEGAHVDCVRDHFHRFGYILARRLK